MSAKQTEQKQLGVQLQQKLTNSPGFWFLPLEKKFQKILEFSKKNATKFCNFSFYFRVRKIVNFFQIHFQRKSMYILHFHPTQNAHNKFYGIKF